MEPYSKWIFLLVFIFAILLLIPLFYLCKKSTPNISKSSLTTSGDDICEKGCINGTCSKNICKCNNGWTGVDCNTKLPKNIKLKGFVYSDNDKECKYQECSSTDICWADKETCDNNNPTKSSYIYYSPTTKSDKTKSWGPDGVSGYCEKGTAANCEKGLNNGGFKADGNLALSDKAKTLCYPDDENGAARCLSDFYSNTSIKNSTNKPAYWVRTTTNYNDNSCEKVGDEYCCSSYAVHSNPNCNGSEYCGTSPGQINHDYTKGSMIFNDSCFIGKDACIKGTHDISEQDIPGVEPVPKCINGNICTDSSEECLNAKDCHIVPVKNAEDCIKQAETPIYNLITYMGNKNTGKAPSCVAVTDGNTRTNKFINGICYNIANKDIEGGCVKVNDQNPVDWNTESKQRCIDDQKNGFGRGCGGGCYSTNDAAFAANKSYLSNFGCNSVTYQQ